MPCTCDPPTAAELLPESLRTKKLQDAVTRLACDQVKHLRDQGKPIPIWACEWVAIHERIDFERAEQQKRKECRDQLLATAKSKIRNLTEAERKILGLNNL